MSPVVKHHLFVQHKFFLCCQQSPVLLAKVFFAVICSDWLPVDHLSLYSTKHKIIHLGG
jgi:hypothetical protein